VPAEGEAELDRPLAQQGPQEWAPPVPAEGEAERDHPVAREEPKAKMP
jgi:hypothetical protein